MFRLRPQCSAARNEQARQYEDLVLSGRWILRIGSVVEENSARKTVSMSGRASNTLRQQRSASGDGCLPVFLCERDQVFVGETNGSSCEERRPKPLIQPPSSTRAKPCEGRKHPLFFLKAGGWGGLVYKSGY